MKKLYTILIMIYFINPTFSQSKKEQIATLTSQIDSLHVLLITTRDSLTKVIGGFNTTITGLNLEMTQLKNDISSLESSKDKLTIDNDKLKLDLEEMSKKNFELETKLNVIELEEKNKSTILQFRLILFNESESPINPEKTIADYKIEIRDGNNVITFFESENAASAFLTDDKDVVYIYPDSGAHYTYTFDKKKDDEVVIFLNFFYPDLDREVWSKTYKKDRNNNWKLVSCDGDCD